MPDFTATKAEVRVIIEIAQRAIQHIPALRQAGLTVADIMMDIEAAHSNGCPLQLLELSKADDSNFFHDVLGINRHLDRSTGKIGDCFLPRFAQREVQQ